jgi:hypothetical protein
MSPESKTVAFNPEALALTLLALALNLKPETVYSPAWTIMGSSVAPVLSGG